MNSFIKLRIKENVTGLIGEYVFATKYIKYIEKLADGQCLITLMDAFHKGKVLEISPLNTFDEIAEKLCK